MADGNGSAARWQDELYDLLRRHNVTQFAYVPDAGHRILIDRSLADPGALSVALTTEEEGVALLAGADLGGVRGVLLMQSSGTGNSPVRMAGPCVSIMMPMNRCRALAAERISLVACRTQLCVPCDILIRTAFNPALSIDSIIGRCFDTGPSVARIFAFRI